MSFEEFDKKVKEAADHHHPPYDENAWKGMEKLLDQHLPQKKDGKRRILFLFLLLALLTGGGWFLIEKPWQSTVVAGKEVEKPVTTPLSDSKTSSAQEEEALLPETSLPNTNIGITKNNENSGQQIIVSPGGGNVNQPDNTRGANSNFLTRKNTATKSQPGKEDNQTINVNDKLKGQPEIAGVKLNDINNDITALTGEIVSNKKDAELTQPSGKLKDEKKETVNEVAKEENRINESLAVNKSTQKKQAKAKSGFLFSVSTGPDVSAVGTRTGKVNLLLGLGVGYRFNNRMTLRTGFYSASKIYTATRDEYNPDQPVPYPYLDHIDADCKVYEIPVTLGYQINKSGKNNYFVSGGVSSLIMKKETYDYVYKYPTGNSYTHTVNFDNKNKHLFSVLSISGGVSRQLSPAVGISAEPYLKLPLQGIGNGNIKLNSAGILLSLQVNPFNKKNHPPK